MILYAEGKLRGGVVDGITVRNGQQVVAIRDPALRDALNKSSPMRDTRRIFGGTVSQIYSYAPQDGEGVKYASGAVVAYGNHLLPFLGNDELSNPDSPFIPKQLGGTSTDFTRGMSASAAQGTGLGNVLGGVTWALAGNEGGAAAEVSSTGATGAAAADTGFLGAKRLSMQLSAEQAAGVRAPTEINSFSTHVLEQMAGRDGGRGVNLASLNDAWANPLKIEYVPTEKGPTFRYTGKDAVIVVNDRGNVVTGWAKSSEGIGK